MTRDTYLEARWNNLDLKYGNLTKIGWSDVMLISISENCQLSSVGIDQKAMLGGLF